MSSNLLKQSCQASLVTETHVKLKFDGTSAIGKKTAAYPREFYEGHVVIEKEILEELGTHLEESDLFKVSRRSVPNRFLCLFSLLCSSYAGYFSVNSTTDNLVVG